MIQICNAPASEEEIASADAVRAEYALPGASKAYMEDVVRAFRVAQGAQVYIEVGTQDKGNIAWMARTKLAKGATIIDIDMLDYPQSDSRIKNELAGQFDYHAVRGNCLGEEVLSEVKRILQGRAADIIFCDSHYTYEHTLTEFTLYYPLTRKGGFLLFHDSQWPGDPAQDGEMGKKGKGLAIEQLDRFYPAWVVVGPEQPLFRPMPVPQYAGHWGTLALFPG
jgi:cephalosporin hydroxylase